MRFARCYARRPHPSGQPRAVGDVGRAWGPCHRRRHPWRPPGTAPLRQPRMARRGGCPRSVDERARRGSPPRWLTPPPLRYRSTNVLRAGFAVYPPIGEDSSDSKASVRPMIDAQDVHSTAEHPRRPAQADLLDDHVRRILALMLRQASPRCQIPVYRAGNVGRCIGVRTTPRDAADDCALRPLVNDEDPFVAAARVDAIAACQQQIIRPDIWPFTATPHRGSVLVGLDHHRW